MGPERLHSSSNGRALNLRSVNKRVLQTSDVGNRETVTSRRPKSVRRSIGNWRSDFPIREEVEDCAGRQRSFVIDCHEVPLGCTVRASEEGTDGMGYEFAAYSETSPYSALGRVRQKIARGLATRHITTGHGEHRMLHDELKGRITSDGEGGVLFVVDGIPLGIEDIESFFMPREGWEFEVRIVDALE